MVNTGMQLISFTCAVTGWVMAIAVTALPQWKVTAFIGSNILTSEIVWQGIWMNCIYQTTGHMQCKTYDSMLALPPDIQAARALMCIAIFLGWLSCTVSCCGMKCTTCAGDDLHAKAGIALSGGVLFILTGLCILCHCQCGDHVHVCHLKSHLSALFLSLLIHQTHANAVDYGSFIMLSVIYILYLLLYCLVCIYSYVCKVLFFKVSILHH
uniref:Uncharacterized protein n=1 Tax=Cyprinus carpio TaxID=7962 RepID=A0A8C1QXJ3_CYPCA